MTVNKKLNSVEQKNCVLKFAHEFATPKASQLPVDKHCYPADCRTTQDDRRQPSASHQVAREAEMLQ